MLGVSQAGLWVIFPTLPDPGLGGSGLHDRVCTEPASFSCRGLADEQKPIYHARRATGHQGPITWNVLKQTQFTVQKPGIQEG